MSFNYLRTGVLQLGQTRLPICPVGPAIISKQPGGPVLRQRAVQRAGAERTPRQLAAASCRCRRPARRAANSLDSVGMRLGKAASPIVFEQLGLTGSFVGSGISVAFQRRALDDRQRPAADERGVGHVAGPSRRPQRRRALTAFRPRREPAILSAEERQPAPHARRRLGPRGRHARASGERDAGDGGQYRAPPVDRSRPRDARRPGPDVRAEPSAGRSDPADPRRDRVGQRHHHAGRAGSTGSARRSPRAAISRLPAPISPRRSGRSPECAARSISTICSTSPRRPGR